MEKLIEFTLAFSISDQIIDNPIIFLCGMNIIFLFEKMIYEFILAKFCGLKC